MGGLNIGFRDGNGRREFANMVWTYDDIDIKGRQKAVELGDVVRQRLPLIGREGCWVGEDAPERHDGQIDRSGRAAPGSEEG